MPPPRVRQIGSSVYNNNNNNNNIMYLRAWHLTFSFPRRMTRGDTLKVINGRGLHIIIKYIIQKRLASHITHVVTDHCYTHTHTFIYIIIAGIYFYVMYYVNIMYNYYRTCMVYHDNRHDGGFVYMYLPV
jgi:hypothetical protein